MIANGAKMQQLLTCQIFCAILDLLHSFLVDIMKKFFSSFFLYIFLAIIAILIIIGLVITGGRIFDFIANVVNNLGGGLMGIFLLIAIVAGICFVIYGVGHMPSSWAVALENAPKIVQTFVGFLILLFIGGLISAFCVLGS